MSRRVNVSVTPSQRGFFIEAGTTTFRCSANVAVTLFEELGAALNEQARKAQVVERVVVTLRPADGRGPAQRRVVYQRPTPPPIKPDGRTAYDADVRGQEPHGCLEILAALEQQEADDGR